MRNDMISNIHKDLRGARIVARGATKKVSELDRAMPKEYSRMPKIVLPKPVVPTISLAEVLEKRSSFKKNDATTNTALSLETLSTLLASLQTKNAQGDSHRTYPSGGGLYPIETYIIASVGSGILNVFHYHPKLHVLEQLWEVPKPLGLFDIFGEHLEGGGSVSAAIIFTSVWERSACKYGDFAYLLGMLEAGHMAQNILLMSTALEIGARPIGGFNDASVNDILDIDGWDEQAVYTIALF